MTRSSLAVRGRVGLRRRLATRSTLVFLGAWAALFVVAMAWVVASPLSSGPDESGHVAKAAGVVRDQLDGAPTSSAGVTTFRVPADVGDVGGAMTCFAGNPNRWAACAPSADSLSRAAHVVRSGVGSYDPLYYALVGWPSLVLHGAHSFFAMRATSALLSTFLLAIVFWVAARSDRSRPLVIGAAIATTPMVLYLGAVVNASGLEVSGTAAVTALGWSILHGRRRPATSEVVLFAVAVVLTASARTTSPLFVVIVLVALCCTVPWARLLAVAGTRTVWRAAIVAAVLVVPALVWTVAVAVPGGYIPSSDPARPGIRAAVWHALWSLGSYGQGMIGVFGWQDSVAPGPVLTGWTAGIGAAVVLGLVTIRRAWMPVGLLSASVLLLPALLQATSAHRLGYVWQGRYGLPVLVALVLVAVALGGRAASVRTSPVPLTAVLWTAWGVAQVTSFVMVYHRYSVGVGGPWDVVWRGGGWQAPHGLAPWLALDVIGSAGLLAVAILVALGPRSRDALRTEVSAVSGVARVSGCRSAN
ncbi:DUF2142 domain-containing protein [Curtobacterium sp. VKM Ac-2922]|uniref:DUF2142 domain-containing protein n=1 Tax=Curtobacterium sp. VKM Ac-2922 TaxID=2929475 RepID=UPI001FB3A831|nr:DUF2142 domain-containing protein [Curtobacterium sp. VKM Ac-2922]MCJ1713368.1 DUF2142 domain-containing protein [Curtobacterium sp. VKM Ac-2922]